MAESSHELGITIGTQASETSVKIKELANSITSVKTAISATTSELNKLAEVNINGLLDRIEVINNAMSALGNTASATKNLFEQLNKISSAMQASTSLEENQAITEKILAQTEKAEKISELAKAVRSTKTAISGTTRELTKLSEVDTNPLLQKIEVITNAMKSLGNTVSTSSEFFKEFNKAFASMQTNTVLEKNQAMTEKILAQKDLVNAKIDTENVKTNRQNALLEKTNLQVKKLKDNSTSTSKSMSKLFDVGKLYLFWNLTSKLRSALSKALTYATDFAETANLFQKSMGTYTSSATTFVNKITEAFGLASETVMNYQSTFNNVMKSLGGISDSTAYELSETLTQMALDYSSLFNFSVSSSMEKLQSALVRTNEGYKR